MQAFFSRHRLNQPRLRLEQRRKGRVFGGQLGGELLSAAPSRCDFLLQHITGVP